MLLQVFIDRLYKIFRGAKEFNEEAILVETCL